MGGGYGERQRDSRWYSTKAQGTSEEGRIKALDHIGNSRQGASLHPVPDVQQSGLSS